MSQQDPVNNLTYIFQDSVQAGVCLRLTCLGRHAAADFIRERAEEGYAKYGTYLARNNGRDAMQDLVEELADASCYAEQLVQEGILTPTQGGHFTDLFADVFERWCNR